MDVKEKSGARLTEGSESGEVAIGEHAHACGASFWEPRGGKGLAEWLRIMLALFKCSLKERRLRACVRKLERQLLDLGIQPREPLLKQRQPLTLHGVDRDAGKDVN